MLENTSSLSMTTGTVISLHTWYVILEVNLAVASTCQDGPSIRQISRAAIEMIYIQRG